MGALILRQLKDRRVAIIAYGVSVILLAWMYIALFPSIQEQSAQFNELLKNYPEGILKAFNITELSFDRIENFMAVEQYSILWPIIALFLVVSLAGGALAHEVGTGTAEILLARPVSRLRLFAARYLSGVIILALFVVCSVFSTVPLAALYDVEVALPNHLTLALLCFLFGLATFSVGLAVSARVSEKGRAYAIAGGLLVVMYALNLVASLKESLDWLKYGSFFHYFDYQAALVHHELAWLNVAVLVGTAVISAAVGALVFHRRDVAT